MALIQQGLARLERWIIFKPVTASIITRSPRTQCLPPLFPFLHTENLYATHLRR